MKNGKLPAYPNTIDVLVHGKEGLTKREYFAAMAMQGMCAMENKGDFNSLEESFSTMAKFSVACADALLAELEKA